MKTVLACCILSGAAVAASATEVGILSGSGTMSFDLPTFLGQTPLDSFDAAFGITETRTQVLSGLPGNNPAASQTWAINPVGTPSPTGRSVQGSTLAIDPTNILGTWGGVASDFGAFASGGEQIGFGGMTRWLVDPAFGGGKLLFGDWGLRYSPARAGTLAGSTTNVRSGLVLTSNIDFLNATFVDIGNASISVAGDTLTITGDMLVSNGLVALGFPSSNLGLDVGDFTLTATLAPAPGAAALLGAGGLVALRRRRPL
jgi:MYXO-CTERM domain-containing protein